MIAEVEEVRVDYELNIPNCKLINPYVIEKVYNYKDSPIKEIPWDERPQVSIENTNIDYKFEIYPWQEYTNDQEILIFSEYLVTIVEPKPELLEAYLKATE